MLQLWTTLLCSIMQMQVYKKVIVLLDFNNFFALYNWCKLLSKSGDAYHARKNIEKRISNG